MINNSGVGVDYVLKIQEINTTNISPTDVKYGFEKDGVPTIDLVSNIVDNTLDTGTIPASTTIEYTLRLWIDSSVTNISQIQGRTMSLRFNLDVEQSSGMHLQLYLIRQ